MNTKRKGPKSVPSQVQLPGGIVLKGLSFKIIEYNADGSPKTFELLPRNTDTVKLASDPDVCTLFAHEEWIRSPLRYAIPDELKK